MLKEQKFLLNKELDEIFYLYGDNLNLSNHAFPLYLFTKRLYKQLEETKRKDVLFMSREGQFLKKLFDRYCAIRNEHGLSTTEIKSHYFYGSRNSIMTASVKPLEEENFESLFHFFGILMSAEMFMFSIGFSDEQIASVKSSFNQPIDKMHVNFAKSKVFKELKQNKEFCKIYEANRQKQSKCFAEYMKSFDVDFKKDGLVFVDIGYHGTMQDLIYKFFDAKVDITGYFLKCRAGEVEHNKKFGLLSDNLNKKLFGNKITKYDAFNYEQILRADHGRCCGYEVDENGVGRPVIDTKHDDVEIFNKLVGPLQDQIFEKFEKIAHLEAQGLKDIDAACIVYNYYTVKNKSKQDFDWILDMQDCHHDDFGFVGYPGKVFKRGLRKFAFKFKDFFFLLNHKGYGNKFKKQFNKSNAKAL